MAETDILNPKRGYDPEIGDSMNPNYGWTRDRQSTLAVTKPAGGYPFTRETSNAGVTYRLNFTRRNLKVTERLKRFFEQFETEYFTLKDWDTGRHYVGRFTGNMPQSIEANGRYTSQGWTFEEVPGAPMLEYPSDWERWGIAQRPVDADGNQRTACTALAPNTWSQPAAVVGDDGVARVPRQLLLPFCTPGSDSITHEYRGYGFRLWCGVGPGYGSANLYVDGVFVQLVDFYAADEQGVQVVFENTKMPLDIHRVQLVMAGNAPGTNGVPFPAGMLWDVIEVMR